jgi:hypothetical protein
MKTLPYDTARCAGDRNGSQRESVIMTRWQELPAHIKITYQSQAQYELQQGILCDEDLEVKTD